MYPTEHVQTVASATRSIASAKDHSSKPVKDHSSKPVKAREIKPSGKLPSSGSGTTGKRSKRGNDTGIELSSWLLDPTNTIIFEGKPLSMAERRTVYAVAVLLVKHECTQSRIGTLVDASTELARLYVQNGKNARDLARAIGLQFQFDRTLKAGELVYAQVHNTHLGMSNATDASSELEHVTRCNYYMRFGRLLDLNSDYLTTTDVERAELDLFQCSFQAHTESLLAAN